MGERTSKGKGQSREARRSDGGPSGWFFQKRPVLGFVIAFGVLMGAFYAITFVPYVEQHVLPAYMRANARASTVILNWFGEGAQTRGTSVSSQRYSVDIRHGCDAIEPSALFLSAVLAFPAPLRSKIPGLLLGTVVLAIINLIRIVSLFYTGIYKPTWFEAMHVDVWQPAFILFSLTFWVLWALWATRAATTPSHDSTATS